jgi:hypothetical protein
MRVLLENRLDGATTRYLGGSTRPPTSERATPSKRPRPQVIEFAARDQTNNLIVPAAEV